jgi:hypothetical protein
MKTEVKHGFLAAATLAILAAVDSPGAPVVSNLSDSGPGSLREAIAATVSGTITFAPGLRGTITLTSGELTNGSSITIQGPGATNITVDGNASSRVFEIVGGATVNIYDLTISNGLVSDPSIAYGGGILINGGCNLFLSNCWIVNNHAVGANSNGGKDAGGAQGGGFYNNGSLALWGCTVSGNAANGGHANASGIRGGDAAGGGICNVSGFIGLANSTVTGNVAAGGDNIPPEPSNNETPGNARGGGILTSYGAFGNITLTMAHCTVSGNAATPGSGDYTALGTAAGGGLDDTFDPPTQLIDTIIAVNTCAGGSGPDVNGTVDSSGFNLVGDTSGSSGWIASDLTRATPPAIDPLLGPLQNNGGPTPTMLPQPGSAAVDAGTTAGYSTDQRGLRRPWHLLSTPPVQGDGSDIGAVEVQPSIMYIGQRLTSGQLNRLQIGLSWVPEPEPGWKYHLEQKSASGGILGSGWETSSIPVMTLNGTNFSVINSPTDSGLFRLSLPVP